MRNFKKTGTGILMVILILGMMLPAAGCGSDGSGNDKSGDGVKSSIETWQKKSGSDEEVTVTWWLMGGTDEYAQYYWAEMKGLQQIQKNTGVNIDFKVATSYDAYLPMMAARNYPDVVTAPNLMRYPGRLDALYTDGVSVNLGTYMDKGLMPNLSRIIEDYPDLARDIRLDDGTYTFVSTFYDIHDDKDRILASNCGPAVRADWLEVIGKDIPTNMDEWYEVLSAFKTQDPNGNGLQDEEPVCMASSGWKYFLPAYGIDDDPSVMFDDAGNATVVYGFMTPEYKEWLAEMNKWYQEGLIFNMFDKTSIEALQQQVTSNLSGAWKGNVTNFDEVDEESLINLLRQKAPDAEFAACPWPQTKDGYQWNFSEIVSFDTETTVITSNAVKNGVDEAAAYLLDYMLSEEGSTLLTWGIEGESYEVVDGEKQVIEEMKDMVEFHGKNIQKFATYADAVTYSFPNMGQLADYVLSNQNEGYINACKTWSEGDITYKMQAATQLTVEQQQKIEDSEDTMKTYISKMRHRFITGKEPLTNYDNYIQQVKLLGGDEFVEIWQQAYDGWKNR